MQVEAPKNANLRAHLAHRREMHIMRPSLANNLDSIALNIFSACHQRQGSDSISRFGWPF
jgi:hypothetical protein